jgi:uncharacterized protein YndB with AHSA1/START domain
MTSIKNLFHIASPKEKVYNAISTIDGLSNWWTTQTSGESKDGEVIHFRFGDLGRADMKVTGLQPNELVSWECVGGPDDWIGNAFTFKLDDNDGKTRVRFEHAGWKEAGDHYASCAFSWGRYMESLRQYCQTGTGEAFGSETYKK